MEPTRLDFFIAPEHCLVYPPMPLSCISVVEGSGTTPIGAWARMTALWTWIRRASQTFYRIVAVPSLSELAHAKRMLALSRTSGTPSSSTVLIPSQTQTITLPPAQPSQILTIYSNDPLRLSLLGTESGSWIIHGPIRVNAGSKWLWWL